MMEFFKNFATSWMRDNPGKPMIILVMTESVSDSSVWFKLANGISQTSGLEDSSSST
jgi:hypothetical protein